MWDDEISVNFDVFIMNLSVQEKKKERWRAEEEALGSSSA
jgi:hypothetical protein